MKNDLSTNKHRAFTIIEVVLVLAVAGLIFLVVFAAIPRLQASRRDNQRKSDADPSEGEYTVGTPGATAPAAAGSSLDFVVVVGLERGNYCIEKPA